MNNYSFAPQANQIGSSSPYLRQCGMMYIIQSPQELDYIPVQTFGEYAVAGICPRTQQIYLRVYNNGSCTTSSYSLDSSNETSKDNTTPSIIDTIHQLESRISQIERCLNNINTQNQNQGGRYNELL